MSDLHYGLVQIEGRWVVIAPGLRTHAFDSHEKAKAAAQRMIDQSVGLGLDVHLHLQDSDGALRHTVQQGA